MWDKDGPRVNYVFGPVPSRRLGQSLGIDPIPLKTCNWNCVYCQLGRTRPVTNERREYFPVEKILLEVEQALGSRENDTIDWVTFVGSGETTLHCRLGEMIRAVKTMTALPVAVITNGSMLYLSEVRAELMEADAILPTLDAGSIKLYRQINRPHPDVTFEHLVNGLTAIRAEYPGKLWVEVMLILGLNDSPQALEGIAKILGKIRPDAIHINLPTRPPAETWVQPTDEAGLMRALSILGDVAEMAGRRAIRNHGDRQVRCMGGVIEDLDIQHRRQPAQPLGADPERIDLVVDLQPQFLQPGFGTPRCKFMNVDRIHQ